ncbi:MAG: MFS transporter [Planctomycetes bacterium]|nr:MFS transporter [Planctomycetota bacterium]
MAPIAHSAAFRRRRLLNWFPLGLAYAFLYMGRYNLNVAQRALGDSLMDKAAFGDIFGVGTAVYGCAFLLNGPLTDRFGGKRSMLAGVLGAALANLGMGLYVQHVLGLAVPSSSPIRSVMMALYAANMYFQSFGAVAIVKVNAPWFHVRERGAFSGIFGAMISLGLYFAFDANDWILRAFSATDPGAPRPVWVVFYAPMALLAAMFTVELFLLKDRPAQAGHADFDTGDASSGEDDRPIPPFTLIRRILTNPVILTVACIEFCTGVLRQGVMQWYPILAKARIEGLKAAGGDPGGWLFWKDHWGLVLMIAGIAGGVFAGWVSDRVFGSRRAPTCALLYALLTACCAGMYFSLDQAMVLGVMVFFVSLGVIGTHGLLSGTATMDFGGRKGAATAVGIVDGFVYLGSAVQGFALGRLTTIDWHWWPPFLVPFALAGLVLLARIWHAIPGPRRPAASP